MVTILGRQRNEPTFTSNPFASLTAVAKPADLCRRAELTANPRESPPIASVRTLNEALKEFVNPFLVGCTIPPAAAQNAAHSGLRFPADNDRSIRHRLIGNANN